MFAYWLFMNLNTHNISEINFSYDINEFTNKIWELIPYNTKFNAVIWYDVDNLLGTGSHWS